MIALELLDMVIIGIAVVFAIIGLFRGIVKESITLLTWIIAVFVALTYGQTIGNMFGNVSTDLVRQLIGGFILFIGVLIIGGIVNIIVSKFIKISCLVVPDKILGACFGILKYTLIIFIVLPFATETYKDKSWWKESVLIPRLLLLTEYAKPMSEYVKTKFPQEFMKDNSKYKSNTNKVRKIKH